MERLMDFRNILENLFEGIYCVDAQRKIVFWNRGAERITGYSAAEVLGSSCSENILVHVDEEGRNLCIAGCPLSETIETGRHHTEGRIFLHHKNGHRVPVSVSVSVIRDAGGRQVGAIEIFREDHEVSHDERFIEDLRTAALIDPLTGIANRRHLEKKLVAALDEKRRHGTSFAVLFIDIDHFKKINDTYGHEAGDKVLKMVSRTMSGVMRSYNLLGRWGGEEFIGIISHIDREGLKVLARKMGVLVESSFLEYEGRKIGVTITIGGSIACSDDSISDILKRVDAYMYKGKNEGRNCIIIDGEVVQKCQV